jgi:triphosphatase
VSGDNQPIETEIKLHFLPEARPLLGRHPAFGSPQASEADEREEVTTYFDTPELALSRLGISLRVRRIGLRYVQTVKIMGNDHGAAKSRGEWEWAIANDAPDFVRLAETPVSSVLRPADRAALQPVFTTRIYRTIRQLRLEAGTLAEIALDEGSIIAGRASEPISELELELKAGRLGPLYRLALDLAVALPLTIEVASKAERGCRLLTGGTPRASKPPDVSVSVDASAAEAFGRIVASVVGHMLANVPAAQLADAEGVHQLRVAIRRIRAALVLFKPLLHPETTRRYNAELRRIGQVFGEARDWDVFVLETLPAAATDVPVPGWLDLERETAEAKRIAAHCVVQDELRSTAFTRLILSIAGWIEDGVHSPAVLGNGEMGQAIVDIAPALLDNMAHKVAKRGYALDDASPEELHAFRKSVKKLRYAVEFLSALYPPNEVKAYVDACKELQELLGKINDAAMTPMLAARLSEGEHADLAPAIGSLAAWSGKRGKMAWHRLPKVWHAVRRTEQFWS